MKTFADMNCIHAKHLENATKLAQKNAAAHDVILLAPACASYDQFKNFEDRGDSFKKLFHETKKMVQNNEDTN